MWKTVVVVWVVEVRVFQPFYASPPPFPTPKKIYTNQKKIAGMCGCPRSVSYLYQRVDAVINSQQLK